MDVLTSLPAEWSSLNVSVDDNRCPAPRVDSGNVVETLSHQLYQFVTFVHKTLRDCPLEQVQTKTSQFEHHIYALGAALKWEAGRFGIYLPRSSQGADHADIVLSLPPDTHGDLSAPGHGYIDPRTATVFGSQLAHDWAMRVRDVVHSYDGPINTDASVLSPFNWTDDTHDRVTGGHMFSTNSTPPELISILTPTIVPYGSLNQSPHLNTPLSRAASHAQHTIRSSDRTEPCESYPEARDISRSRKRRYLARPSTVNVVADEDYSQLFVGVDDEKRSVMISVYTSAFTYDSLTRLRWLLLALKGSDKQIIPNGRMTVADIFQELDSLEGLQHLSVLRRRTLMYTLANLKIELLDNVEYRRTRQTEAASQAYQGRPASEVIDLLVLKAYPYTNDQTAITDPPAWREKYEYRRKSVRNRLHAAKNWKQATVRFPLGILAVIPFGEDSTLQNTRFESLSNTECDMLLAALETKENGCIIKAAAKLTPFVQALCDGMHYTGTLRLNMVNETSWAAVNSAELLSLFEEIVDDVGTSEELMA